MKKLNLFSRMCSPREGAQKDESRTRLRVVFDSFTCRLRVCPLKLVSVLAILLTIGVGNVWATDITWSWTASSGALGTTKTHTATLTGSTSPSTPSENSKTWDVSRSRVVYTSWTNSCIQLGSSSGAESVTLSSVDFSGTIKSVYVECSSYGAKHSVAISVGETSYLTSTATASWTTVNSKGGTGSAKGEITITFTANSSARALYIKSIQVVYEPNFDGPYSVIYLGNGKTSGSVPVDGDTHAKNSDVTVLGNTGNMAKTGGYFFDGWNTKKDYTGTHYDAGGTISSISKDMILYAQWTSDAANKTFNLVDDVSDLEPGSQIVIVGVNSSTYYAMSTQRDNNRLAVAASSREFTMTESNTVLTTARTTTVEMLTLTDASGDRFGFQTLSGDYLYAASSTNNYLKTKSYAGSLDADAEWTIGLSAGTFSVTADQSSNNMIMRFNYNNDNPALFSCYGTATNTAVKIYQLEDPNPAVTVGTPSGTSFSYTYGSGPSSSETFAINGKNLTDDVVISAPSNYKIKNGSGSWVDEITLTPTDGAIASTTISIQLASGLGAGSYNGNITFTNGDDLDISNIALTGTVSKASLSPAFGSDTYTITRDMSTSTTFTLTDVPNDYTGDITYTRTNTPTASARLAIDGSTKTFTAASYSGRWTVTAQFAADDNYNAKTSGVTCTVNAVTRDTYIDNVNDQSVTDSQRTDNGVDTYVAPSLDDVDAGDACKGKKIHLVGWATSAFVANVGNGTYTGADSDYTQSNGFYAVGATLPAASGATYYAVWAEEESE